MNNRSSWLRGLVAVGRRALRKIDPSLDLSRHLLEFEQLPRPWSAEAIFGRIARRWKSR